MASFRLATVLLTLSLAIHSPLVYFVAVLLLTYLNYIRPEDEASINV